ncbi:MAG: hypothetical protein ACFFE8_03925 [Candidatus Heimdallarchaeota archaeon]
MKGKEERAWRGGKGIRVGRGEKRGSRGKKGVKIIHKQYKLLEGAL